MLRGVALPQCDLIFGRGQRVTHNDHGADVNAARTSVQFGGGLSRSLDYSPNSVRRSIEAAAYEPSIPPGSFTELPHEVASGRASSAHPHSQSPRRPSTCESMRATGAQTPV